MTMGVKKYYEDKIEQEYERIEELKEELADREENISALKQEFAEALVWEKEKESEHREYERSCLFEKYSY